MPYRTQEELDDDMERDPKLARARVAKAKRAGLPVISPRNPGYSSARSPKQDKKDMTAAVSRRMAANIQKKKPEEDEIADKRKKVGY